MFTFALLHHIAAAAAFALLHHIAAAAFALLHHIAAAAFAFPVGQSLLLVATNHRSHNVMIGKLHLYTNIND